MENRVEKWLRLVLVPLPYEGHITPMLQLGTILHSEGFSITVVHTKFNSPNPSNHPHFTFLEIPDSLSQEQITSADFIALILALNTNCQTPLHKLLAQIMMKQEEQHEEKIACIIYDGLMFFAEVAAARLKLPSIIFRPNSAANMQTTDAYPLVRKEGYLNFQDSMPLDLVPELYPLRYKDLPSFGIGNLEGLLELKAKTYKTRSSLAMIWNTIDFLEQLPLAKLQQQLRVPFFCIGPLHRIATVSFSSLRKEDTSCITWLDKQPNKSVIYVSLGSIATIEENKLSEIAWGLAKSKQRFLWVIRPGLVDGAEWNELLPQGFKESVGENGYIVKWAPQKEVLAHVAIGGFWSHCGWNSTLESICEGVPMICQPCFGDQRVNARYLSRVWKVGLELEEDSERGAMERAIRKLMADKDGEEMRQRAKDLKEKIDLCIRKGGSSNNSIIELVNLIKSF